MSSDFTFKQFKIQQPSAIFKVGTDSVVLGAWVDIQSSIRILDIGTGTGLLALMCAQRNSSASITAIEKDLHSAQDAQLNAQNSLWKERLSVHHISLKDFEPDILFDYIICNPPYFLNALLPENERKANARHAEENWFEKLAEKINQWTLSDATFGCVLPPKEFECLSAKLKILGWYPQRIQKLLPYPGGEKIRVLSEWKRRHSNMHELPNIYVRNAEREFSEGYQLLTTDFYLKF